MLRRSLALLLSLCLLAAIGSGQTVAQESETDHDAVINVLTHDLGRDGQHLLTQQLSEQRVDLKYNDMLFYQQATAGDVFFHQLLLGDMNADSKQEAIVVEIDKTATPYRASYLLYGVTTQGWRQLDSLTVTYEDSLSSMLVELSPDGQQFLLNISRTSEDEYGLSYVEGYSLYRLMFDLAKPDGSFGLVKQANPDKLVRLKIGDDKLIEKYAVFPDDSRWPKSINRVHYLWNGKALIEQKQETADHYYLEEMRLPELFEQVAREQGIPLEVLKAVADQESNSRQFDYGDHLISPDGGIGLMQVTPQDGQVQISHLGRTYRGDDIERLKWDTYFNLTVGAQILRDKWLSAFGANATLPRVGENNPANLESWYFALWAYNGYVKANFPGEDWGRVYQEKVINQMPSFSLAEFAYPAFLAWNQGDSLPEGGRVYPVQQQSKGTILTIAPGSVLILPKEGNLRKDPAIYATRTGILGAGSKLTIVEDTGESMLAVHVDQDSKGLLTGASGFVSKDYVDLSPEGAVVRDDVNLRTAAETPTTRLGTLSPSDVVEVVEAEPEGWLQVTVVHSNESELVGQVGYVSRLTGTGLDDPALQLGDQITLLSMINLRSYPAIGSEEYYSNVVAMLSAGQEVQVISGPEFNTYDGYLWYQVRAGELTGYLAAGLMMEQDNPSELFCTLEEPRLQDGRMVVTGRSKPGVSVDLLIGGVVVGSTMTDTSGKFAFSAQSTAEPLRLRARAYDHRGELTAGSPEIAWEPTLDSVYTVIGSQEYVVGVDKVVGFNGKTAFRSGGGVTVMAIHLFRELGASVTYISGRITIVYNGIAIELSQGSGSMQITSDAGIRQITLRAPIVNVGGRTYIPTRDVSENLGFDVKWDGSSDSILITAQ